MKELLLFPGGTMYGIKKILEDFDEQTKFDQSNTSYLSLDNYYQEGPPNPWTPTFIPNRLLNQEVHKALNTDKQLESGWNMLK